MGKRAEMTTILWLAAPHNKLMATPVNARKSVHGYIVDGRKGSKKLGKDVFKTEAGARRKARELRDALSRYYEKKIEEFA